MKKVTPIRIESSLLIKSKKKAIKDKHPSWSAYVRELIRKDCQRAS